VVFAEHAAAPGQGVLAYGQFFSGSPDSHLYGEQPSRPPATTHARA
jgi:hypothetical protein